MRKGPLAGQTRQVAVNARRAARGQHPIAIEAWALIARIDPLLVYHDLSTGEIAPGPAFFHPVDCFHECLTHERAASCLAHAPSVSALAGSRRHTSRKLMLASTTPALSSRAYGVYTVCPSANCHCFAGQNSRVRMTNVSTWRELCHSRGATYRPTIPLDAASAASAIYEAREEPLC